VTQTGPVDHTVQFYEHPDALSDSASFFLQRGLTAGDASVVVVRESFRERIEERLRARRFGLDAALAQGRFVALDAEPTVERCLEGGVLIEATFERIIGGVLEEATARSASGRVRILGETASLLWDRGLTEAAVRIERLGNRLAEGRPVSIYCAYPLRSFGHLAHTRPFLDICAAHSRVVPGESFTRLSEETARGREVALLQQKALALEAEVAARKDGSA